MGWSGGTKILDEVFGMLLRNPENNIKLITKTLIKALEDQDCDTLDESRYAKHPIMRSAMAELGRQKNTQPKELDAVISSANLEIGQHDALVPWIYLQYLSGAGAMQGFGGFRLAYRDRNEEEDEPTIIDGGYTGRFIWRLLETVGVDNWNDLPKCIVRVRLSNIGTIHAIGHHTEDKWFCPTEELND